MSPSIVPGIAKGKLCHGCGRPLSESVMIVGIVRSGFETSMIVTLCPTCGQTRLGDLQCVNCSRGDVAQLFDVLARGGGVSING